MLLGQSSRYMFASAVSAVAGLAGAYVFTRLLSPVEFGVYVVGTSAAGIVAAVLFTWVRFAAVRFPKEAGAADPRATVLATYLSSCLVAPPAALAVAAAWGLSWPQAAAATAFALALGLFEMGQELLKSRLAGNAFVAASMLRSVFAFSLGFASAASLGSGTVQLAAVAGAYALVGLIMGPTIWRGQIGSFDRRLFMTFLQLGAPLTISGLIFALHAALDRFAVVKIFGEHAAGLYGASADLTRQLVLVPASGVAAAAVPLAVHAMRVGPAETAAQLRSGAELLLAVVIPTVVGLALTAPSFVEVALGSEYRSAAAVLMPILGVAWLFQVFSQSYVHISYHLAKRPDLTLYQSLATLGVNGAVVWPLTIHFGLVGAAIAPVLAEATGAFYGLYLARRAYALPSLLGPLLRVGGAASVMAIVVGAAAFVMPRNAPLTFFALAALGIVIYAAAALALDVVGGRSVAKTWIDRIRSSAQRSQATAAAASSQTTSSS